MSFSFASQDSLSPWHHIVELASVFLSVSLRLSSFLVELLSLMNGVVTETHTAGPAYRVWQLTVHTLLSNTLDAVAVLRQTGLSLGLVTNPHYTGRLQ